MLGLAGSNSVSLQPAVRIACTDEAFNIKTKHAVIKRVTDPFGSGSGPKNRQYKRDDELMRRLESYVSALPQPYPNPEGRGTNRVPVRLLSNNPDEIVAMRRRMQTGPQLTCECNAWRPKTEDEAKHDGLPWPPPEADRERYFVSLPGEDMGATWYTYGADFRLSEKKPVVCNPMTCPYAGGFVPSEKQKAKPCKPETVINVQLGDWGGGELAFVHAESWATAQRFNTALAIVYEACGGNVAGIEVDVCLEYTKAQHVPGGSKTRHPYWVVAIPYGMSETEFRERAILQRQKLLADVSEMARLHGLTQQLLGEARMAWRAGALLPEFQPYKQLGPGDVLDTVEMVNDPRGPARAVVTVATQEAAGILRTSYEMSAEEAAAMVQANVSDLGGMFERLGPPPEAESEEDEEPPALEGVVEEAEPVPDAPTPEDDVPDGEYEQEGPADEAAEEDVPAPAEVPVEEAAAPPPVADTPAPAPEIPLMFPDGPDNGYLIQHRFELLGEKADFDRLVAATWKKVAQVVRTEVPSPGTCESPEQMDACLATLLHKAEVWWRKIGYAKHGGDDQ